MKSYLTTFITYISALLLKGNGSLKMDFFVKILWNSSLEELSSKATHCVVHTQSHKFTAFIWKHAKPTSRNICKRICNSIKNCLCHIIICSNSRSSIACWSTGSEQVYSNEKTENLINRFFIHINCSILLITNVGFVSRRKLSELFYGSLIFNIN